MTNVKSYAGETCKGMTLIKWNFATAAAFFIMAFSIFIGWDTPAICYQLTAVFGLPFLINGFLGTTKVGYSKFWKFSSYFIGSLIVLFALRGLYRQLTLGQRGLFVGTNYYSILAAMTIIGLIGLLYLYIHRTGFRSFKSRQEMF